LPAIVDPDRWLDVLDGQRFVRKVRANGTISVDTTTYYLDQAWAGRYVSLRLTAATRSFRVEEHERTIKEVPIKGLIGDLLPLATYVDLMAQAARPQTIGGRPIGHQLRLPLETVDTIPTGGVCVWFTIIVTSRFPIIVSPPSARQPAITQTRGSRCRYTPWSRCQKTLQRGFDVDTPFGLDVRK
jgi:hypothetical protein